MNKKVAALISLLAIGNLSFPTSFTSIAKSVGVAVAALGSSEGMCLNSEGFNIKLACADVQDDYGWPNANNPIFSDENCESILASLCVGQGFTLQGDFCSECTEWSSEERSVDSRALVVRPGAQVGYYYPRIKGCDIETQICS